MAMKHKARLTISRPSCSDGKKVILIQVEDEEAKIRFLELEIGLEEFSEVIVGRRSMECDMLVRGIENVGKVIETKWIEFEVSDCEWRDRENMASKLADETAPEGWVASHYFGSQGSFFTKDGKSYARTTISRWVDKEEEQQ